MRLVLKSAWLGVPGRLAPTFVRTITGYDDRRANHSKGILNEPTRWFGTGPIMFKTRLVECRKPVFLDRSRLPLALWYWF